MHNTRLKAEKQKQLGDEGGGAQAMNGNACDNNGIRKRGHQVSSDNE